MCVCVCHQLQLYDLPLSVAFLSLTELYLERETNACHKYQSSLPIFRNKIRTYIQRKEATRLEGRVFRPRKGKVMTQNNFSYLLFPYFHRPCSLTDAFIFSSAWTLNRKSWQDREFRRKLVRTEKRRYEGKRGNRGEGNMLVYT